MNIDLSKIVEKLKSVPDEKISGSLKEWGIEENSSLNALMLNGLAKRIPTISHSDSEKFFIIWGQVFLRTYAAFVLMRNDILESKLHDIEEPSLHLFKKVFEKGEEGRPISTESPNGLCRRIRNSIAHGTFSINGEKGEIEFTDYRITVVVEGYELIEFCKQIERLYLHIPMEDFILRQSSGC